MSTASHSKKLPKSRQGKARARELHARRSRRFFVGGTLGLIALFAVAIALSRTSDQQQSIPQARSVTVSGEPLPVLGGTDAAIGLVAPEIAGSSFDGDKVTLANDGTPKMILFLAHWCPHCQVEVPLVQSWLDSRGMPGGVDLVSVATATDRARPNYPPSEWLEREKWTVPVMVDDEASSAGQAYGVSSYPFFVFVGADGTVVHRASGELSIEHLEDILAGL